MKHNRVKFLYMSFLLAIYCMVMGLYSYSTVFTPASITTNHTPVTELHEFISSVKIFHTPQSGNIAKVLNNYPSPTFKTSPFKLFLSLGYEANLVATKFSSYYFFSHNLMVRFVQTDIIFPFHYFW